MQATIQHLDNPRVEKEAHYYNAAHSKLIDLGLQPHFLSDTLIDSVMHIVYAHRDQVRPELVLPSVNWRQTSSPLSHTPS
jgi:UDP-sulfoquinovose synthase